MVKLGEFGVNRKGMNVEKITYINHLENRFSLQHKY